MELYDIWCANAVDDTDLQNELKSITSDEQAIRERFYRDLEFGTGGLRGVLGAGTNRMNIYTVRRATQGLPTMSRHPLLIRVLQFPMTAASSPMYLRKLLRPYWLRMVLRFTSTVS